MLVFTVPALHQIKQAGFRSINPAKGFRLLQAEASHLEVTTRGPHLAQHMVDRLRNIVLFSCPHVYLSTVRIPKIVQTIKLALTGY